CLGDDGAAHLALADAAVGEDDRDFTDGETALERSIGQLDLESVSAGADAFEVDAFEDLAAEALEAAGQVADADAEDGPGVEAAALREQAAAEAPVDRAAAFDVAAAEDEVGFARGFEQSGQRGGVVREIRVHLDDAAVPAGERFGETGQVGAAEAFFSFPVEDVQARLPRGQLVGERAGAVGGVVV